MAQPPRNRLELARWLVRPDHPLLARVTVNRIWQQLVRRGPGEDERELWLAGRSAQPSGAARLAGQRADAQRLEREGPAEDDPAQRHLSAVVGSLAQAAGARSGKPPAGARAAVSAAGVRAARSGAGHQRAAGRGAVRAAHEAVHAAAACGNRSPTTSTSRTTARLSIAAACTPSGGGRFRRRLLTTLNAAEREVCVVRKDRTNTPLQALTLMNNVAFVEASRFLAERMLREARRRSAGADSLWLHAGHGPRSLRRRAVGARRAPSIVPRALSARPARGRSPAERSARSRATSRSMPSQHAAMTMTASLLLNLDETLSKE